MSCRDGAASLLALLVYRRPGRILDTVPLHLCDHLCGSWYLGRARRSCVVSS